VPTIRSAALVVDLISLFHGLSNAEPFYLRYLISCYGHIDTAAQYNRTRSRAKTNKTNIYMVWKHDAKQYIYFKTSS